MGSDGPGDAPALDHATAVFVEVRPRLLGIAYRMLGSVSEAEDIVQEAWIRWQAADRAAVIDAGAFLATMTIRLAINVSQSARSRRETYVGPWLAEPIDTSTDPGVGAERGEALELAVLLLLERLPPLERAAYMLREALDYSFAQIGDTLRVSEANARQLATRARKHLAAERRAPVDVGEQRRLVEAFLSAARGRDAAALARLVAPDAMSPSDGGGAVGVARKPDAGRGRVARFLEAVSTWLWSDARLTWVEANRRAGLLVERDGGAYALLTIDAGADGIDRIYWVMHPDELGGMGHAASADGSR